MNLLLGLCAANAAACTASAGSKTLGQATDGSVTASASIAVAAGTAFLRVRLPGGPLPLRRVSLRPIVGAAAPVKLVLELAGGGTVAAGTWYPNASYSWVHAVGPWQNVVALKLTSTAAFTVCCSVGGLPACAAAVLTSPVAGAVTLAEYMYALKARECCASGWYAYHHQPSPPATPAPRRSRSWGPLLCPALSRPQWTWARCRPWAP